MKSNFIEDFFGLMEIVWLWVICMFLLFTIPIWIIPFTAFKLWKSNESFLKGKKA